MWFKNLWNKLFSFGKNLVAFIAPIVAKHGADLLETALPLALNIVATYESKGTDGETKRQLATDQLKSALIAQGRSSAQDLSTSTLNWIVETALQKLRASSPSS